jgi:hypothetical protein
VIVSGLLASEGGYQVFDLRGGEWAVLFLSALAAVIAIIVGFFLAKNVLAQDEGSPKMREIAERSRKVPPRTCAVSSRRSG